MCTYKLIKSEHGVPELKPTCQRKMKKNSWSPRGQSGGWKVSPKTITRTKIWLTVSTNVCQTHADPNNALRSCWQNFTKIVMDLIGSETAMTRQTTLVKSYYSKRVVQSAITEWSTVFCQQPNFTSIQCGEKRQYMFISSCRPVSIYYYSRF